MSGYIEDEARIIALSKKYERYGESRLIILMAIGTDDAREAARRELLRRRVMGGRG